jgi:hypothetical protein
LFLRNPRGKYIHSYKCVPRRWSSKNSSSLPRIFGQHERGAKKPAIAFCDALAENESARQVMGESILRVIAHELVVSIKDSVSVDWMHREIARARMRVW